MVAVVRMQTLLSLPLTAMVAMLSTEGPVAAVPLMMLTVARAVHLFMVGPEVAVAAQTQEVVSKTVA